MTTEEYNINETPLGTKVWKLSGEIIQKHSNNAYYLLMELATDHKGSIPLKINWCCKLTDEVVANLLGYTLLDNVTADSLFGRGASVSEIEYGLVKLSFNETSTVVVTHNNRTCFVLDIMTIPKDERSNRPHYQRGIIEMLPQMEVRNFGENPHNVFAKVYMNRCYNFSSEIVPFPYTDRVFQPSNLSHIKCYSADVRCYRDYNTDPKKRNAFVVCNIELFLVNANEHVYEARIVNDDETMGIVACKSFSVSCEVPGMHRRIIVMEVGDRINQLAYLLLYSVKKNNMRSTAPRLLSTDTGSNFVSMTNIDHCHAGSTGFADCSICISSICYLELEKYLRATERSHGNEVTFERHRMLTRDERGLSVFSECGHVFHKKCLLEYVDSMPPKQAYGFKGIQCPNCRKLSADIFNYATKGKVEIYTMTLNRIIENTLSDTAASIHLENL